MYCILLIVSILFELHHSKMVKRLRFREDFLIFDMLTRGSASKSLVLTYLLLLMYRVDLAVLRFRYIHGYEYSNSDI